MDIGKAFLAEQLCRLLGPTVSGAYQRDGLFQMAGEFGQAGFQDLQGDVPSAFDVAQFTLVVFVAAHIEYQQSGILVHALLQFVDVQRRPLS